jgi:hypothetical protein
MQEVGKASLRYILNAPSIGPQAIGPQTAQVSEAAAPTVPTELFLSGASPLGPPPLSRKRSLPGDERAQSRVLPKRICAPSSEPQPLPGEAQPGPTACMQHASTPAQLDRQGMVNFGTSEEDADSVMAMLNQLGYAHGPIQRMLSKVRHAAYSPQSVQVLARNLRALSVFQDKLASKQVLRGGSIFDLEEFFVTNLASRNMVKDFLECMAQMTQVKRLRLIQLNLSSLSTSPDFLSRWTNLVSLVLNGTSLERFDLGSNLHYLDLSNNVIAGISLEGLTNLSVCALQGNLLCEFIYPRDGLPKLREVKLGDNKLEDLPPMLENSPVEILSIFKNEFKRIPLVVQRLKGLTRLQISNNRDITAIEPEILELPKLGSLGASRCGIRELPIFQVKRCALRTVDLSFNQLTSVPPDCWFELRCVRTIDLRGNPLPNPVIAAIEARMRVVSSRGHFPPKFILPPPK